MATGEFMPRSGLRWYAKHDAEDTILRTAYHPQPRSAGRAKDGGGEDSQTEPAKIGTAAPYFLKVPFEASHLSFQNSCFSITHIISYHLSTCREKNEPLPISFPEIGTIDSTLIP